MQRYVRLLLGLERTSIRSRHHEMGGREQAISRLVTTAIENFAGLPFGQLEPEGYNYPVSNSSSKLKSAHRKRANLECGYVQLH